ncbi:hypothetical protein [Halalkalicoccus salilacus]|uniref:hypothetical protein n=1 Tax=Halalkalicoccus salilacus TaxID=3117459 RepID=UPI00300EA67C
MSGLTFQTGITALLLATATLLVVGALFPALPLTACTEVGYAGAAPGGPALYALEGTELVYTSDGVNECSTHVAVPGVPVALSLLGAVLVGVSLFRRE